MKKINVAVNGYGVIGKRVAEAVALQKDMQLAGVGDVAADWRIKAAAVKVPETLIHLHYWTVQLTKEVSKEEVLEAFANSTRTAWYEHE